MRIPNAVHEARPWRIREITPDFELEDVWALPVHGEAADFPALVEVMFTLDPANGPSLPTRVLWRARDRLGTLFGLDGISGPNDRASIGRQLPIPGTHETSLVDRLPRDLRHTVADLDVDVAPFAPVYQTDVEFAAELSNRTVHAAIHLAWVEVDEHGDGRYHGQMAVYVKPRGAFGQAYMAFIKPFRYGIVYPAVMRQIEHAWNTRMAHVGVA